MSAKVQGALFPLMFATNQPYTVNQQAESEYKDLPSKDARFHSDRLVFLVTKYRQELSNPSLLGFTMVRHKVIIQLS